METREQGALRLFNSACECIESEKYKEAYDYLVRSSELSGADARYILGIWYLFGVDCISLKQNIPEAIFCLIKSAYKGNMSSKIFLKTFLDIDIDASNLTEENINSTIKNIVIYKCKDIESITKEDKSKILEYIKNPYIVQPIMKEKQITPEKPTLFKQHNISMQGDREKDVKCKPKLKHNKKLSLLKKNLQLKGENVKLKMKNMILVNINETLEQEVKETKKEWQDMYNELIRVITLLQNTQQQLRTIQQPIEQQYTMLSQTEQNYLAQLNQFINTTNPTYQIQQYNQLKSVTNQINMLFPQYDGYNYIPR